MTLCKAKVTVSCKAAPKAAAGKAAPKAAAATAPKATALNLAQKAAAGKAAAKNTQKPTDVELFWPKIKGPTAESNPRCQLTAFQVFKSKNVRVHVCTLRQNSWGMIFSRDVQNMAAHIEKGGFSKDDALALRDKLKNARSILISS